MLDAFFAVYPSDRPANHSPTGSQDAVALHFTDLKLTPNQNKNPGGKFKQERSDSFSQEMAENIPPAFIPFMLANSAKDPFDSPDWIFEGATPRALSKLGRRQTRRPS